MFGYERITDNRPRFDAGADSLGPDREAAERRLLRLLVEHHDLRPADPRPRAPGQYIGQPFAGNVIPANRISPIAKKILEVLQPAEEPRPGRQHLRLDAPGADGPRTTPSPAASTRRSPSSNRMFARYSYYTRNSTYNDYLNSVATHTMFQFVSYQAVVDDVHVFNPTTVLNVRYGYNRFDRISGYQGRGLRFRPDEAGLPGGVQRAGARGRPALPASRFRRATWSTSRSAATAGR